MGIESREFIAHHAERDRRSESIELVLGSVAHERPDEREFGDLYPQQTIDRDLEVVRILEQKFAENIEHLNPEQMKRVEEGKKRSEALEVMIVEGGELHNWFGDNVFSSRTSVYDDYNGIDAVLEIVWDGDATEQEPHNIALAVDASMRPDFSSIERKIRRNIEKVTGPKKPRVKYFQSAVNGEKKSLHMVLPVVVGVEGKHADELIGMFADVIRMRAKKEKSDETKERLKKTLDGIAKHPAQVLFLQEIGLQLDGYAELFAKRQDKDSRAYGEKAKELSEIIYGIINEKTDVDPSKYIEDGVFLAIEEVAERMGK